MRYHTNTTTLSTRVRNTNDVIEEITIEPGDAIIGPDGTIKAFSVACGKLTGDYVLDSRNADDTERNDSLGELLVSYGFMRAIGTVIPIVRVGGEAVRFIRWVAASEAADRLMDWLDGREEPDGEYGYYNVASGNLVYPVVLKAAS